MLDAAAACYKLKPCLALLQGNGQGQEIALADIGACWGYARPMALGWTNEQADAEQTTVMSSSLCTRPMRRHLDRTAAEQISSNELGAIISRCKLWQVSRRRKGRIVPVMCKSQTLKLAL